MCLPGPIAATASLILRGLPQLDTLWQPLFRQWGMRLSLIGVFCHQTPKASFQGDGKNEAPELVVNCISQRKNASSLAV